MPTRNSNLLLSDAAAPVTGVDNANIIQWFGGPFSAVFTGTFVGKTVEIVHCIKYPTTGLGLAPDNVTPTIPATDWVPLIGYNGPNDFQIDNLNPCLLAIRVVAPDSSMRVRVAIN